MRINVRLEGVQAARNQLARMGRKVDPVVRGTLNTTATKTRNEQYVRPLNTTLKAKRVRQAIRIKRARRNLVQSRLIPSGAGVPVVEYASWGFDVLDKTRARIWVRGVHGRKVAAGFVNPSSVKQLPWMTKSVKNSDNKTYTYARALKTAIAPSVAHWFAQITTSNTVRWVNQFMAQELTRRLQQELNKP